MIFAEEWLPRVFDDYDRDVERRWHKRMNTAPAVNVLETEKAYKVEVAVPGMTKDDFRIHLDEGNNLVISMEKKDDNSQHEGKYLRREFSYAKFEQTLILPEDVDVEKIAATVNNGLLAIELPKIVKEELPKEKRTIEVR